MVKIGVPREVRAGETRVALTPISLALLTGAGLQVSIEAGAGSAAGFSDDAYRAKGAEVVASHEAALDADVVLCVHASSAIPAGGAPAAERAHGGPVVIGFCNPLSTPDVVATLADTRATTIAMELIPRVTRAQSMDALSSQATVAGYRAAVLAAHGLPKMFPMLTTAAGTITPARVLVVGAGVAGLQAIATARRLGAVVEAYDVRAASKEQVQSVGARFVELDVDPGDAEDQGGYARALDESFYERQRELLARVVAASDAVITTALVPGKRAPVLITAEMVAAMTPGSVIVDVAAEQGGNCEVTRADETVVAHGVTVVGSTNLAASIPFHASNLYARNVATLLLHMVDEGELRVDLEDEILRAAVVTRGGEVVHPGVRDALGLGEDGHPSRDRDTSAAANGRNHPAAETGAAPAGDRQAERETPVEDRAG